MLKYSCLRDYSATTPVDLTGMCAWRDTGDEHQDALGTFRRIEEFDEANREWLVYVEWLEHYFEANAIGAVMYKILWNIVSPDKPADVRQPGGGTDEVL